MMNSYITIFMMILTGMAAYLKSRLLNPSPAFQVIDRPISRYGKQDRQAELSTKYDIY
jgi:hypothetical protein